jgi:hypothetical protein
MTTFNGGNALAAVTHMEKVWLFWSSTRGSGGDVFYATIAPRLGPDVNAGQSITVGGTFINPSLVSPGRRAQAQAAAADFARRHPFVLPPALRGSYIQRFSGSSPRPSSANR